MSLDKEIRDCLLNYDADVETCKLLLTRARDELARREWQPIETCPNRTTVNLLFHTGAVRVGERNEKGYNPVGYKQVWLLDPTHWMPLPATPDEG